VDGHAGAPTSALTEAPGDSQASAGPSPKPSFPLPPAVPVLAAAEGVRFDFNHGARVVLPPRSVGRWRVRLKDMNTGNILFQSENQGATVRSAKRWFVRFSVEVWDIGEDGAERAVLAHDYDPAGKDVLIQFPVGTLGDVLAWFPYAARFAETHAGCRVTCVLSGLIIPLLRDAYPGLRLVTREEAEAEQLAEQAYATYSLGLFFDDAACEWQPTDFRHVGLHRTAAYILGVSPEEEAPRLAATDAEPPIEGPYACIAVQSSSGCKYWNNPAGWRDVVTFLKARGYRVICIDQKPVHGSGVMWTHIPHGAEDETGDRPLAERARWLRHASLFVGLSSGLSWLAWAAGCPVVLISGFTHPTNEFFTPYRVINWHACNSCWNDPAVRFDHKDFMWCPRHAGSARHFECTRLITPQQVTSTIQRIPGFALQALAFS
jgi:autotransporter strand-loop-strand O-heptosyltransferase